MIAEDLGIVTNRVTALRREFGFPGMRVLQFGFEEEFGGSEHLPKNYPERCVAYTGTHDNDTLAGWLMSLSRADSRSGPKNVRRQLRAIQEEYGREPGSIADRIISDLFASRANLVIIPFQDLLHLDSRARMNLPGTADGNWEWRFTENMIRKDYGERLRKLTMETGRSLTVETGRKSTGR